MRRVRLRICEIARNTTYDKERGCVPLLACLAVRVTSHLGVAKNTAGQASSGTRER